MKAKNEKCLCGAGENIVMACSGASDVGFISDKVARMLQVAGKRKMNCLAVVGANIHHSIEKFKKSNVLIIDGCPVDCGKKIADRAGLSNYNYFRITDLGFKKGETKITDAVIQRVYEKASLIY